METDLKKASNRRLGIIADPEPEPQVELEAIDQAVDVLMLSAKTTGPRARHKLRFLLRYYAKKAHPFRACVRDNMKRFGPGKTEAYCATLKDIIRGTTKWRGKNNPRDKGTPGLANLAEEGGFIIDDELAELLDQITDEQIEAATEILATNWKGGGSS